MKIQLGPFLLLCSITLVMQSGAGYAADLVQQATTRQQLPRNCLTCHAGERYTNGYRGSVHKNVACGACHVEGPSEPRQVVTINPAKKRCVISFKPAGCSNCHVQMVNDHAASVHNSKRLPVSCAKCHFEIHTIKSRKNDKAAIAEDCKRCHEQQSGYFKSTHYKAIVEGRNDAAVCTDCHGLHAIEKVGKRQQLFRTVACLKCHSDEKIMARAKMTTAPVTTFFETYHGKSVRLGYPQKVAGCADCHRAHAILKTNDAHSAVNQANIVKTCSNCHSHASPSFAQFISHAEHGDRKKSPALFWTFVGMTALLVGTFLVFWIHSTLWAFRSFVENRRRARAASFPSEKKWARFAKTHREAQDGNKLYQRFKPIHIFLHILVVISFLGLALTGLPLKFSHTHWGKMLIDFIGGTGVAGAIHRTCAVITFIYFGIAVALSVHFLFFDEKEKGTFREKLLGPDSLFPNRRDWQDIKGMFKWFFFRGPKPTFERWTYWEKFDFLAVFWGMLAIGSSGLMLWFPTFFAKIVPGWMFNVATLIHSDEALLATGFIFTVHFFNTHFRPEKFPMDFVIFNGEISKEEMLEERADQWKRYEAEGITRKFEVTRPSPVFWDFVLKAFGFAAVVIGLSLAIAMVYTFVMH